jgi:capsular polysaccharide biosynthesis protein
VIPVALPRWARDFLRSEFLGEVPGPGTERLYVSRATARRGRKVANERQVLRALAKHGFRKVVPDELSVAEQARLFASAAAVVAPHGAALTNLVFCPPRTAVVELFAPTYVHPVYWMLAAQCELDYHYLVGKGERPERWSGWPGDWRSGLDEIVVDLRELRSLLEAVLVS